MGSLLGLVLSDVLDPPDGTYLMLRNTMMLTLPGALLLALPLLSAGGAPAEAGVVAFCAGVPATITGTEGRDDLEGTDGPDVIAALGGLDRVDALGGDDVVCGGDGVDVLSGGEGDDQLRGEKGADVLYGEEGADRLTGAVGDDYLDGSLQDDVTSGGLGADTTFGGAGADIITGGDGRDVVSYRGVFRPVRVDLRDKGPNNGSAADGPSGSRDTIRSTEGVLGGFAPKGDVLIGDGQANVLDGQMGEDRLFGRGGNDSLVGDDDDVAIGGYVFEDRLDCGTGRDEAFVDDEDARPVGCEEVVQHTN